MAAAIKIKVKVPEWLDWICAWPVIVYRRHKYGYPYRRIALMEGKFSIVDPQDYYWLNNYDWCAKGRKGHIYAVRFDNTCEREKTIWMHREIMKAPKGILVDHRNSDDLDNRRDNLRLATYSQNGYNSRIDKSKASSQYRGVRFRKKSVRWVVVLRHQGKKIWIGSFKTELEAARAYDAAARKYHGEFARLNFPENIKAN
jgi:hypothetical protein